MSIPKLHDHQAGACLSHSARTAMGQLHTPYAAEIHLMLACISHRGYCLVDVEIYGEGAGGGRSGQERGVCAPTPHGCESRTALRYTVLLQGLLNYIPSHQLTLYLQPSAPLPRTHDTNSATPIPVAVQCYHASCPRSRSEPLRSSLS